MLGLTAGTVACGTSADEAGDTEAPANELRLLARRCVPRMVFDFIDGGADDEITVRRNREAFDRVELAPRALVDVETRDQSVTVLGRRLPTPLVLGPLDSPASPTRAARPRSPAPQVSAACRSF